MANASPAPVLTSVTRRWPLRQVVIRVPGPYSSSPPTDAVSSSAVPERATTWAPLAVHGFARDAADAPTGSAVMAPAVSVRIATPTARLTPTRRLYTDL